MKRERPDPLQDAAARLAEERLFAAVLREIESGVRKDGVWAKALTDASFDEKKAKTLYVQYRIQSLKDELLVREAQLEQQREQQRIEEQERLWRLKEKAIVLANGYYARIEFEVWFNTTDFTHRDADREYIGFLEKRIIEEGIPY
jgi:hypothetical protein